MTRARALTNSVLAGLVALLASASGAWADHGPGLRTAGWSPLTTALVFGGLALLAGMLVIVIVTLLTRRRGGPP